jgi:hypothetical protein
MYLTGESAWFSFTLASKSMANMEHGRAYRTEIVSTQDQPSFELKCTGTRELI